MSGATSLRICLLTHICWPETADFKNLPMARDLASRGHRVTIITGFPNYPIGRVYDGYRMQWRQWEIVDGVRILRLPLYPDHSRSGLRRMINYLSFSLSASTLGLALSGPVDVLFVYSPPMTLGIPARLFKVFRGSRVLLDVVDLWPEAVTGSGMANSPVVTAATAWFARQAYRTADAITVLTKGFDERVKAAVPDARRAIEIVPPWSSAHPLVQPEGAIYSDHRLSKKFCVLHTGNIGPFQDMDTILAAARLLRDNDDVRILLVGGGRDYESMRSRVSAEGLANLVLTGAVASERIPAILAGADCCLVSLADDPYLEINIPSKLAGYLAAGRPIIANAGGEVAALVREESIGLTSTPGDPEALRDRILQMRDLSDRQRADMGARALKVHARHFDFVTGLERYSRMISGLAVRDRPYERTSVDSEISRIRRVYHRRAYDTDGTYADTNPVYLQRVQRLERHILTALQRTGLAQRLSELDVLDFGCGNGRWLGRWLAWGADPRRLHGVDVRPDAIEMARTAFPDMDLREYDGRILPYLDASFDVVYQNLVMSSILDRQTRSAAAREMRRVLRPGGLILWYDLVVDNPRNPDVRGVPRREVRDLFPGLRSAIDKRLTLAPPLARRIVPLSWGLAESLESALPAVRTHRFIALR